MNDTTVVEPVLDPNELERVLSEESTQEEREREALFAILVLALQEQDKFNVHAVWSVVREFQLDDIRAEAQAYVEDEAAALGEDDEDEYMIPRE